MLPAHRSPEGMPASAPAIRCSSAWTDDRATITVEGGHRITGERVRELTVIGTAEGTVTWAERGVDGPAAFPVEPGDSITVPVDAETGDLRVAALLPESATTLCTLPPGGRS